MLPDALSASALGRTASLSATLRERVEAATAQVSTGRAATLHGDLGAAARGSIDLRAETGRLDTAAQTAARPQGTGLSGYLWAGHGIPGSWPMTMRRCCALPDKNCGISWESKR
ncbi:MAG: hypothetical protein ACK4ST_12630, partial [Elioraea tepidiphila]